MYILIIVTHFTYFGQFYELFLITLYSKMLFYIYLLQKLFFEPKTLKFAVISLDLQKIKVHVTKFTFWIIYVF